MKQFIALFALVSVACAAPRYLVIPLEDVEFVGPASEEPLPVVRFRRAAEEELPVQARQNVPQFLRPLPQATRRQDLGAPVVVPAGPGPVGPGPNSFIGAIGAAGIPSAADNLAAGSSHLPAHKGSDYVDYGAYTGKHGAFGWYSDHPVLLIGHH